MEKEEKVFSGWDFYHFSRELICKFFFPEIEEYLTARNNGIKFQVPSNSSQNFFLSLNSIHSLEKDFSAKFRNIFETIYSN